VPASPLEPSQDVPSISTSSQPSMKPPEQPNNDEVRTAEIPLHRLSAEREKTRTVSKDELDCAENGQAELAQALGTASENAIRSQVRKISYSSLYLMSNLHPTHCLTLRETMNSQM